MLRSSYRTKTPPRRQVSASPVIFDATLVHQALTDVQRVKENVEKYKSDSTKRIDNSLSEMFRSSEQKVTRQLNLLSTQNNAEYKRYVRELEKAKAELASARAQFDTDTSYILSELKQKVAAAQLLKGDKGETGKPGKDADEPKIVNNLKVFCQAYITDAIEKASGVIKKLIFLDIQKELEKLRADIRQVSSKTMMGGGGMGTIKYFKFTCDDTTTAFTLPDRPTQEGNAVFAFYQGQRLHPTDHYTVSGTTITTTFTGETGSFVDGFIIT
jgi:hypothetical protein